METVPLRRAVAAVTAGLVASVLAACSDEGSNSLSPEASSYHQAESSPQRDSLYPGVGNGTVDVLHYDLDLTWDPAHRRLTGVETITLRGTARDDRILLDLDRGLRPDAVEVDGAPVDADRNGLHLEIPGHIAPSRRTVVRLEYSGVPSGVPAPTQRGTLAELGWSVSGDGEVTTIQQPYGAFTWYAVNDTPSDKAFHDVTLRVPATWVGISNGTLEERSVEDGQTVTRWHGSAPAAPSSMTVAIGDYVAAEAETASGLPVTTWTHRDDPISAKAMTKLPGVVDWLEQKLGPYPFEAVGAVVVPGAAGSPTQETTTIATTADSRTEVALVDDLAHQWFGNAVTPAEWRDLWIAEGIPFFLADGAWRMEHGSTPLADVVAAWRGADELHREESGAPVRFARDNFGPASVEYGSALLWQGVQERLGAEEFARVLPEMAAHFSGRSITRDQVVTWLEEETGQTFHGFFKAWLTSPTTPVTKG